MPVAEIFLSALVCSVSRILTSPEFWKFVQREGIHKVLLKWRRMWEQIEAVLADAEDKQMRLDHRGIRVWLEDLEDLAYDLDDVLDEFNTEALRQQAMVDPEASTSKVRALIPTCCTSFNPRSLCSDYRIRAKIDEITTRLQDLFDRRVGLGLQIGAAEPTARAPQRPPSTSFITEPEVHGRHDDKNAIIKLLRGDESSNSKLGVIPIVGMGGIGKTTLAQMVYKDENWGNHFQKKVWVCVSEEFDIMEVTKTILESVTSQPCNFRALDEVQTQLKQALSRKKFLIVLDDVWNKNHEYWNSLISPFNDAAPGSKVVVTTRDMTIAQMMGTVIPYSLNKLSENDCWLVFEQNAFSNSSIDASPNLVATGKKIVEKCDGLPLAARTLGGLLRGKLREDEWEDVLNSKMWELSHDESGILPALRLSYHHLPPHLKKCFAYCSILPKDYEFEEEELVWLWMAEGCIQQQGEGKQMEDLGSAYFRELLSRSLFQRSSTGESSLFVMHDLVNDIAQFFARKICFRLEDMLRDENWRANINKARHSSYTRGILDGKNKFEAFYEAKNLRTFLPCGSRGQRASLLTNNVPLNLLPKLKRLRVLSLRNNRLGELPTSIGDLKHVRFVDLSKALIKQLPESVSTLYNLQTLILRDCINLENLPTNTGNLINLRHLDVTGAESLQEMPPKMSKLTSLQTLSNFIVSKGKGPTIRELGSLVHLRGTLGISGLENVGDALDARGANLKDKQGFDVLLMKWSYNTSDSRNGSVESQVLDMLQPHKKLKELTIRGYHGLKFPAWVGNSVFSNMVSLKFENCEKCTSLPPLGQLPTLAKLYIQGMRAVESVGLEFYGPDCSNPFPSLEKLTFVDMPEWKDWSAFGVDEGAQAFAQLSELSIRRCPKLLCKLPSNLPCVRKLEIEECLQLVVGLVSSPYKGLNEARNILHLDSLIFLSLKNVSNQDPLRSSEAGDRAELENARYSHRSLLTSLRIEGIQQLTCLPSWFVQGLTGLQELMIRGCEEFTTLWQNEVRVRYRLPALRRLVIHSCPQLISLFEEDGEEEEKEGLADMMMLEYLKIGNCEKLEKLSGGLHNLKSLQELTIQNCPCLVSFSNTGLPPTIRTLRIELCGALLSLPELMMLNNLEKLEVGYCPSLRHLICSRTGLPPNLKELNIYSCGKLESLLGEEGMKMSCPSLESIQIWDCGSLKSLPDVMKNNDIRNLSRLGITGCENLESIPEGWFPATTNLRELEISRCGKLEAVLPRYHACDDNSNNYLASLQGLEVDNFPGATGLVSYILKGTGSFASPITDLTSLTLNNVHVNGNPPIEWAGLHRLSSLRDLRLKGYSWESFPPREEEDGMMRMLMMMPTSLISLEIWRFPNLKKLSSSTDFLQNLASLERLYISNCPRLTSISEVVGLLPTLLSLRIHDCPKLASFIPLHAGGLPPSLLLLRIWGCPILKKRCEKGKGKDWPFISHIPEVSFDPRNEMPGHIKVQLLLV